jgi:putative membrane protein
MMWWTSTGPGWVWGIAMMLGMLAFWGFVAWAIVAVVRGLGRPQEPPRGPETILSERFATGEIDEQEFRTRLDALRSVSGGTRT